MPKIQLSKSFIRTTCKLALNEDLYPSGDITTNLLDNNQIKKLYFDDKNIFKINVNQHDFTCDLSVISKKTWNKM